MSNHEGVSCDSCRKQNFTGIRYKCLVCYDYDLCSTCYGTELTSSRHSIDHPMQCILARSDYDLYYGGESITCDQPQSLTCPYCGGLGFDSSTLFDHVNAEHCNMDPSETSTGVVCPICGGDTNQLTYDFATHLTMEHRTPRDITTDQSNISGSAALRGSRGGRCPTRSGGARIRRTQTQFSSAVGIGTSNSGNNNGNTNNCNTSSAPSAGVVSSRLEGISSSRDPIDPLAEILSQLSGVRRAANQSASAGSGQSGIPTNSGSSTSSQLHQLQVQLQASSPSYSGQRATGDRDVRLTRRTLGQSGSTLGGSSCVDGLSSDNVSRMHSTGAPSHHQVPYATLVNDPSSPRQHVSSNGLMSVPSTGWGGPSGSHMLTSNHHSTTSNQLNSGSVGQTTAGAFNPNDSQYLLSRCTEPVMSETEQQQREVSKADRSLFLQELFTQMIPFIS